jgi:hypothetical protein
MGKFRSPKEARRFAVQRNISQSKTPTPKKLPRMKGIEASGRKRARSSSPQERDPSEAGQRLLELSGRVRTKPIKPKPGVDVFGVDQRATQTVTAKRSLMDEQPDALQLTFESRSGTPVQSSRRRPAKRPRRESPEEDDEFMEVQPPRINPATLKRSRAAAAARQPVVRSVSLVDRMNEILDEIHGPERQERKQRERKGVGYRWTKEEEDFLVREIEKYGPAWSDIQGWYCGEGMPLEGRDQAKLKDKARNLKEKWVR